VSGELHTGGHLAAPAVSRLATTSLPTPWANFDCTAYREVQEGSTIVEHLVLSVGLLHADRYGQGRGGERPHPPLVRLHSECLTGDVFGSRRCDCGAQLHQALARIAAEGRGALLYLRGHEGRGIGLGEKIRAYRLQDEGFDTVDANTALGLPVDARDYGVGAAMLRDLGFSAVRLLTNNPAKADGLRRYGMAVAEVVAARTEPSAHNERYLRTKQRRMGHQLE
jgi:3,4-dihydroxy 2-butanone 4-phosphate synthase/GTP cyclohydrolase II